MNFCENDKRKVTGRKDLARQEPARYAEAGRLNNRAFNEWLHGRTGEPKGRARQCWNAAMFLLAFHALQDGIGL